ncbi:hypothetical protein WISP_52418 [Willisornis vidua]|uniref:Uncharacterized protein n=1 Tax=Willisornis vidua TaxID=1566151 RepID=A0ABQ9DHX7_9PASS|nr:hypothetical protein WISP_52418 [Willisornis vidua]
MSPFRAQNSRKVPMGDATSCCLHYLASLAAPLDNVGVRKVIYYALVMSCHVTPCHAKLAWGLSALLTPNSLTLHAACGLEFIRNYEATEPSGNRALVLIVLVKSPMSQQFTPTEELPLYVEVMAHGPL